MLTSTEASAAAPVRPYRQLDLLKLMYLAREGDRREGVLFRQGKGWFQISGSGHEAMAVLGQLLEDDDYLFPYYRDRALVLSRGMTNRELALAYFAKRDSSSGGRQMPAHTSSRRLNIWSVPTPTGSSLLPACGAAWGLQLEGKPGVVVACIGDAACRQGEFYESVAFARERKLPIVFVVEDNGYGISTNTTHMEPFKLGVFNQDIVVPIDARHPDNVLAAAAPAIQLARKGGGPVVLHCSVDRLCNHTSSDDQRTYRTEDDIAAMFERDPVEIVACELIEQGELTSAEWEQTKQEINEQVARDYQSAEAAADPESTEVCDHLFAPAPAAERPPIQTGPNQRMVDSLNAVFREAIGRDRQLVFFGEDIEDPKGGVFKLTAGLSTSHPDQVFNSPLAEATIAGIACGLGCYGMRPVFEMQFVDFIGPAWTQIVQNMATIRWRTAGEWTCPAIIYAPYGAYLPGGGPWHSQANEAWFAHTPGLRVVVPSTPEDAAGLMWTALDADDPTIFLIPKHRLRQRMHVENVQPVPFGKAAVRRTGTDVTVVAWGNCIEQALDAATQLEDDVSVEVIDLRSIVPWDRDAVAGSLEKTGRLVVVQEDAARCSAGQMIVSELTSNSESWDSFLSTPRLVSKADVHVGFNPVYEYGALPDTGQVMDAIRQTMDDC